MGSPIVLFVIVLLIFLAALAGYLLGSAASATAPSEAAALAERDAFIEQLRELAWQHRDVSPELSTIIIDEISTRHRQLPGR